MKLPWAALRQDENLDLLFEREMTDHSEKAALTKRANGNLRDVASDVLAMMREQVDAGILGAVPNVVNAETRRKLLPKNRTIQNDVRASLAADNGTLEIGRPAGIGPGARQEQIENRTPLKRSSDLGAGP